jgi:hypothetical protein
VENKLMLEFPLYSIFIAVGDQFFKRSVGISMGKDCAALLSDLFIFIQGRVY